MAAKVTACWPGATEAVQRDARRLDRPAGGEHGHAADAHRRGRRTELPLPTIDVVDVVGVEADALARARSAPAPAAPGGGCGAASRSALPLPRGDRTPSMIHASPICPQLDS